MRNIYRRLFLILAVLFVAWYSAWPPQESLRLGKDLRGGVSLVYSVQLRATSTENAKEILDKTITALKERVDPNGLFEITMVAQGNDRIEITMPLPTEEVKALKARYDAELRALAEASLTRARLEQTLRLEGAQRAQAIERLANRNEARLSLLTSAAGAADVATSLREAYEGLEDSAAKDEMAIEVASAEIAYEEAISRVMATALSADDVRRVLDLPTRPRVFQGRDGKPVSLSSPREAAEKRLREAHPDSLAEIDRVFAAHAEYTSKRTSLDDPEELKRMLRGSGVLTFRISVDPGQHRDEQELRRKFRELGPRNAGAPDARWYRINRVDGFIHSQEDAIQLEQDDSFAAPYFQRNGYVVEARGGQFYMLNWDTPSTRLTLADHRDNPWSVSSARESRDEIGKPAIAFQMDAVGARYLGQLTRNHVGNRMAVLLDDEVYTAPNLRSTISSNGQITGDFSREEISYIVRVLSGGSLQAALSPDPISESTVAPQLGADNLRMGLMSGVYSVIIVAVFMVIYYFSCGFIAVFSLITTAAVVVGAMAMSKAAFTMPGIAGIILTFGMAVDSNVLIYERLREELLRGADMKTAVRQGFNKALSSIVDGNITNLIVCVVLYYTGTPEIRGFAITMGVGVVATLFSALVVSRFIFDVAVLAGWRRTSMLPMAVPALQRFLTPNINWLKLRYVFFGISAAYISLGLGTIFYQGTRMLDSAFLGGTKVTVQFKTDAATGEAVTQTRQQIQDRVKAIAAAGDAGVALRPLRNAEVIAINPQRDGVTSDRFEIKVGPNDAGVSVDPDAIPQAILAELADLMEVRPPLEFVGSDADGATGPLFALERAALGENVDPISSRRDPIGEFVGGVAILLENITPPTSLATLESRLQGVRESAEFSSTLPRSRRIIITDGDESAVRTAVILVRDDEVSVLDDEALWASDVRDREWDLVQTALTRSSSLAGVQNFSPAIAGTFRADAITATLLSFFFIGIYIWVRFRTLRYSVAAVVALVHDVIAVIGLIAVCEILYEHPATEGLARSLGLLPFKIDLNAVAALLTIAGYSLNDTVVIMDRIRENKGKLPFASAEIINTSINQTFSRTVITGVTTLGSCIILYVFGGEGMRSFAFALGAGLIVGTFSSVAVAAPIVWDRRKEGSPPEAEPLPASTQPVLA
jgi:SecD/SecF fusion protein